jgi:hypothetical protein
MSRVLPLQSDSSDSQEIPRGVRGAWRGGPCHQCGDDMPANLVHCQTCRALLNSELTEDSVEIPKFVPLREIKPARIVAANGHYVPCPGCREELRINRKYRGATVACRFCSHSFSYSQSTEVIALYTDCPHCKEELRASSKYKGKNVACRFCSGQLMLTD